MRRLTVSLLVLALLAPGLVAAGCGGKTKTVSETNASGQVTTRTVPKVRFAKAKFVIHAGLAVGAFRRYIYKPYKAGAFKAGADGRTKAIVKAVAAAAFTANEIRLARRAALSDDTLRGVGDKLTGLVDQAKAAVTSGGVSPAKIAALAGGLTSVAALAKAAGVDIRELAPKGLGG